MGDMEKVTAEIAERFGSREISDACARVIASWYHNGGVSDSYAFVSTGAIDDPSALWREMFPHYSSDTMVLERRMADMLGTYLLHAGRRGPVKGWDSIWL
jgi:hypothetical protein